MHWCACVCLARLPVDWPALTWPRSPYLAPRHITVVGKDNEEVRHRLRAIDPGELKECASP